jgi:hypothetical protein
MGETTYLRADREAEAANFDEMAANSRKISFVRACRGDETGAAFWSGRARGLELAAINLRLPPLLPSTTSPQE